MVRDGELVIDPYGVSWKMHLFIADSVLRVAFSA